MSRAKYDSSWQIIEADYDGAIIKMMLVKHQQFGILDRLLGRWSTTSSQIQLIPVKRINGAFFLTASKPYESLFAYIKRTATPDFHEQDATKVAVRVVSQIERDFTYLMLRAPGIQIPHGGSAVITMD